MLRGLKAQSLWKLTLFYVLLIRSEQQSYASAEDISEEESISTPYIPKNYDEERLSEYLFSSKPQETQIVTIGQTEQSTAINDDTVRSGKALEPRDDHWSTSITRDSPLTTNININSSEQWGRNFTRTPTSWSQEFPDGTGKGTWHELTEYEDHDTRKGRSFPMTTEASASYHTAPDVSVYVITSLLLLSVLRRD
ncbi:uncharacterized protein LOC106472265 [Limulus polyphemus]|uniref:Uncharacterized protein LOC106472265 n=1 Tax=Limulus polyphemus TaxID=6850 RepID=A0ABM1BTG3_LIMPO|nr:uncharacterized protein LOC106472265 [Limulus polyphemus]